MLTESPDKRDYAVYWTRGFTPIRQEIRQAVGLILPRIGIAPRIASLQITDDCNKSCNYCPITSSNSDMTTEEVLTVERKLGQGRVQMLNLTGGEPTTREDLPEIIEYSHKLGMLTTISTNGGEGEGPLGRNDYAFWHNLAEHHLFGAYFSFDGIGAKQDWRVMDLAAFLVNNLHIFGGVRTVVTPDNLDMVYEIGKHCMESNVFFQAVPAIALGGASSSSPEYFQTLDDVGRREYIKIIHALQKVRGPFASFLRVQEQYLNKVIDPASPLWHCQKPSNHWLFVDVQGNARACNERPLSKRYSLKGEENPLLIKQFHRDIREEVRECAGCLWYCNWEENQFQWFRGIIGWRFFVTVASLT